MSEEKANEKTSLGRKIWSIFSKIFTFAVLAFTLVMVVFTIISATSLGSRDRTIFGYHILSVTSGSMSGEFEAGDLIFINAKNAGNADLEPGEIISFISDDPMTLGDTITHRIVEPTTYQGQAAYITKGDANNVADQYPALAKDVLGTYSGKLPGVGRFFVFLKTTPGYITCIFLPFLLMLIVCGYQFVTMFKEYRKEKKASASLPEGKDEKDDSTKKED